MIEFRGKRYDLAIIDSDSYDFRIMLPLHFCALSDSESVFRYRSKLFEGVVASYPVDESIECVLSMLNSKYPISMSVLDLDVIRDVVNGIWSGFPLCCCFDYAVNLNREWKMRAKHGDLGKHRYVMCDGCIASGKRVRVKSGYFEFECGWNFKVRN